MLAKGFEMKTVIEKIGSAYLHVNADGTPVSHKDAEKYRLHIVPKLFIPNADVDCELILAKMTVGEEVFNIKPDVTIIRQPLLNSDYYVAGTSDRKIGWEIEAPDAESINIEFEWDVLGRWQCMIFHKIYINLNKSIQGHVFSFDETDLAMCPEQRIMGFVYASDAKKEYFHKGNQYAIETFEDNQVVKISQDVTLTSKAYSDGMSDVFEDMELLRDQPHITKFTNYVKEFNDITSFTLPAEVLVDAIDAVSGKKLEYVKGKKYCDHPAFEVVRKYLKENNPSGIKYCSYIDLFVRVSDDDELWAANLEHPNMCLSDFSPANYWRLAGCEGIVICQLNQESDNDETDDWTALESLRDFPDNFPKAYNFLNSEVIGF
jgi:hypothetical protein